MTHSHTTSTTTTQTLVLSTDAGYLDLIAQLGGQVISLGQTNVSTSPEAEARP